jgi:hypothetical protein
MLFPAIEVIDLFDFDEATFFDSAIRLLLSRLVFRFQRTSENRFVLFSPEAV